jgi:hypothetical protein
MTQTENDVPADSSDGLRRAVRLLLLLSRIDFTPAQKELAKEEVQSFSAWKLFSSLAVRHGVAALVWQNITDLGLAGSVPEPKRPLWRVCDSSLSQGYHGSLKQRPVSPPCWSRKE